MNANPQFLAQSFTADSAHVDAAAVKPLPNSRKVYVQGSRPDLRVPFREISLAQPIYEPFGSIFKLHKLAFDELVEHLTIN